jgi:hypothetical protein
MSVLKVIEKAMNDLGVNYEFAEWTGDIVYPYFVGEYQEIPSMNEDGMQETAFILTGFARENEGSMNAYVALEETKDKISSHFNKVGGRTVIADNGSAVAVFYSNSLVVPTGDAELKKVQINLEVKEWSVK